MAHGGLRPQHRAARLQGHQGDALLQRTDGDPRERANVVQPFNVQANRRHARVVQQRVDDGADAVTRLVADRYQKGKGQATRLHRQV